MVRWKERYGFPFWGCLFIEMIWFHYIMNWTLPPFLWSILVLENNDIVYGDHAVTEALQTNTGNKLYIQRRISEEKCRQDQALASWGKKCRFLGRQENPTGKWQKADFTRLCSSVAAFTYTDLAAVWNRQPERTRFLLILDGLTDPQSWIYLAGSWCDQCLRSHHS